MVTNQSGVARGYYGEADILELHRWINLELADSMAHIDAFYYCPHHATEGIGPYRVECDCRKPGPGMIRQAFSQWAIDKEKSLLIGDKPSDLDAASAAGIKGYLFDHSRQNIVDFVQQIF